MYAEQLCTSYPYCSSVMAFGSYERFIAPVPESSHGKEKLNSADCKREVFHIGIDGERAQKGVYEITNSSKTR